MIENGYKPALKEALRALRLPVFASEHAALSAMAAKSVSGKYRTSQKISTKPSWKTRSIGFFPMKICWRQIHALLILSGRWNCQIFIVKTRINFTLPAMDKNTAFPCRRSMPIIPLNISDKTKVFRCTVLLTNGICFFIRP